MRHSHDIQNFDWDQEIVNEQMKCEFNTNQTAYIYANELRHYLFIRATNAR